MSEIEIRAAVPDDATWLEAIFHANARDNVAEAERGSRGFVQSAIPEQGLRRWIERPGPGVTVALVDGVGAGAIMAAAADAMPGAAGQPTHPAGRTLQVAHEAFGDDPFFLYGPVVVDERFRGLGLLRKMADALFARAAGQYRHAASFYESENEVSGRVHLDHLGWTKLADVELNGRGYTVMGRDVPAA